VMDVDGQRLHAIHAKSPEADAVPLLLVHGWPGSVFEFEKVVEPLRDPAAHGGRASDASRSSARRYPVTVSRGRPTDQGGTCAESLRHSPS
jgi:pimeloyl-ACP methyl ester carboxylesterase